MHQTLYFDIFLFPCLDDVRVKRNAVVPTGPFSRERTAAYFSRERIAMTLPKKRIGEILVYCAIIQQFEPKDVTEAPSVCGPSSEGCARGGRPFPDPVLTFLFSSTHHTFSVEMSVRTLEALVDAAAQDKKRGTHRKANLAVIMVLLPRSLSA